LTVSQNYNELVNTRHSVDTIKKRLIEEILILEELARRKRENWLAGYAPYKKQAEFHELGNSKRERLFRAGNQLGKTLAGAAEVAMHLTGRYPEWWKGKRFERCVRWMAGSESAELTRKGVQRLLVGTPEDRQAWGTGAIPKECLVGWSMRSGVADAAASITVRHESGANSTLQFASYDQGRTKWQADTLDGVWFDEEPPPDVYSEGITRTNTTMGPVILTMTPLFGMSEVVRRFLSDPTPDRADICMTIEDAEHYTPEERARIIASYPEHERDARTKGYPSLGSGRIFPILESVISVEPFAIPPHWPQIIGIDFGWDHPTAAARLAWDRDADCVYVTAIYRRSESTPVIHAAAIKSWGAWPVAWPHDGLQHDKGSGEELASQYRRQGLKMLKHKATHPPKAGEAEGSGGNGVEAGLMEMLDRMQTRRWRVFSHLTEWFEEFRLYHRKDGKVVKEYDDAISASRYGLMMLRHARTAVELSAYASDDFTGAVYRPTVSSMGV
jgi:phage terminase large subunit-like protein